MKGGRNGVEMHRNIGSINEQKNNGGDLIVGALVNKWID